MDKVTLKKHRILLGRILRQVRLEREIRQEDVADRLGSEQTVVSKTEHGERKLDLAELREYCKALGVALSEVVRRYEERMHATGS